MHLTSLTATSRRVAVAVLTAAALAVLPATAVADSSMADMRGMSAAEHAHMAGSGHDAMPGMSGDEHARMSGSGHDAMPGMSGDEHAQMSGGGHDAMPGMSAHEHAHMDGMPGMSHDAAGSGDHPVGLVLGGFAALWAAVLIYASLLRRRPAARKRRATLARVRAAAGEPTVPSAPEARS